MSYANNISHFEQAFKQKSKISPVDNTAWQQFKASGFENRRNEAFHYLDLNFYTFEAFNIVEHRPLVAQDIRFLPPLSHHFVFHNGYFQETIAPLAVAKPLDFSFQAVDAASNFFNPLTDTSSLITLNQSLHLGTASITIPGNTTIAHPIYIHYFTDTQTNKWMTFPKNYITVEENACAQLIECYWGQGPNSSLLNSMTHINIAKNATLEHIVYSESHPESIHLHNGTVFVAEHGVYNITRCGRNEGIERFDYAVHLQGEYSKTNAQFLDIAPHQQILDNHFCIYHNAAHTSSKTLSRSVVHRTAKRHFTGKIIVGNKAFHTRAALEDKNLLLSPHATANTRPQLEIFTDEVACKHGATVGYLDEEALFYMRARGIPENQARAMLIEAFVNPVFELLKNDFIKSQMKEPLSAAFEI